MSSASKSTRAGPAGHHVALLRGINVGGKNMLPMAQLTKLFTAAGCGEVRTYIQSGNVVFTAAKQGLASLGRKLSESIHERFGFEVPIVLRSAAELGRVVASNPFLAAGADPATLAVAFLAEAPTRGRGAALDPERSPGDAFALRGREVYLHLPNGAARSKLTNAYLDKTLGTVSTARNWRTVLRLWDMVQG